MGLSSPNDTDTDTDEGMKPTFSKDVLRLEISGPNEDHLSVIDVPGIFKNTTSRATSKADIQMVRDMVLGYMKNPRSIMLTVIPANVDIATQEIIEMARDVDPKGERTLGVLTKPDLVDKGAEQRVINLVEGKGFVMKLGWILVRNLGQQELLDGDIDRDSVEESFRHQHPWNTLDPNKFGVKALKVRLQETVLENVRQTFPLVSTIFFFSSFLRVISVTEFYTRYELRLAGDSRLVEMLLMPLELIEGQQNSKRVIFWVLS